jgi:hypothetical protein
MHLPNKLTPVDFLSGAHLAPKSTPVPMTLLGSARPRYKFYAVISSARGTTFVLSRQVFFSDAIFSIIAAKMAAFPTGVLCKIFDLLSSSPARG